MATSTQDAVVDAVGFHRYGGPEVLGIERVTVAAPGPGQLRVRVAATPVNPADTLFREGGVARLVGAAPTPYVPGLELAGVVESVGAGVTLRPGERVLGLTTFIDGGRGCQSELALVDAADVARVPDDVGLTEASTLPMSALTALASLDALELGRGDTVVVVGAAGAVGGYAVQLGALRGLRVVAVARRTDWPLLTRWGAAACLDEGSLGPWLNARVPGGAEAVLDTALLGPELVDLLRPGGRLALVRPMPQEDRERADARGIDVRLISVRAYQGDADRLAGLVELAAAGKLALRVAETLPPTRAADAHRLVDKGGLRGRVVLRWATDETEHDQRRAP